MEGSLFLIQVTETVLFSKIGFYSYNFYKNKKSRYNMKSEKIKETIFVIGTYIFLLLFFYSFIDTNWSSEKLDYFNPYIGALGLLVVVGYIERSQTVLSKKNPVGISFILICIPHHTTLFHSEINIVNILIVC